MQIILFLLTVCFTSCTFLSFYFSFCWMGWIIFYFILIVLSEQIFYLSRTIYIDHIVIFEYVLLQRHLFRFFLITFMVQNMKGEVSYFSIAPMLFHGFMFSDIEFRGEGYKPFRIAILKLFLLMVCIWFHKHALFYLLNVRLNTVIWIFIVIRNWIKVVETSWRSGNFESSLYFLALCTLLVFVGDFYDDLIFILYFFIFASFSSFS